MPALEHCLERELQRSAATAELIKAEARSLCVRAVHITAAVLPDVCSFTLLTAVCFSGISGAEL